MRIIFRMITAEMVLEVHCHHHLMYILHHKLSCHKFKSFNLAHQMFLGKKNNKLQKNVESL